MEERILSSFWDNLKNTFSDIKFSIEHVGYLEEPDKNPKASIRQVFRSSHSKDTLDFGEKSNKIFGETGKKGEVLVTGSCASIDISTVTVAFVEDMIKLHKNNMNVDVKLHEEFKAEYDNRINQYIMDGTF